MEKRGQNNLKDFRDIPSINQDIILLNEMFNTIRQEVKVELERGLHNNESAESAETKANIVQTKVEAIHTKEVDTVHIKELDTVKTKTNKKEEGGMTDVVTERRWDRVNIIKEYTDFVREKIEEYTEKGKEYVIEYINQNNISKFHYDDLQKVLNYFSCMLKFEQKCLLCNKQLTMSLLFLKHLREKKNRRKPTQLFSSKCKTLKNELACYCKCFQSIKLIKCMASSEETCKYVDIIDFFQKNQLFYEKAKNSGLLRNVHKNAVLMNICRTIFHPSQDVELQRKKKIVLQSAFHLNKNKKKVCKKASTFTLKDVKYLNSDVYNLKPFFKMYNLKFNLNTDEQLILLECLKAIRKIKLSTKMDPQTILIFCCLCNLHNAVLRLKVESFFCCYSERRFRFFVKHIWQQIKERTSIKSVSFVSDRCLYNYLKKYEGF